MSAPRVPEGWTQEAADLVWEDWRQRMQGDHVIPIGEWRTRYDLFWYVVEGDIPTAAALRVAGVDVEDAYDYFEGSGIPFVMVRWPNEGAALRAWHAVGAPVVPPDER